MTTKVRMRGRLLWNACVASGLALAGPGPARAEDDEGVQRVVITGKAGWQGFDTAGSRTALDGVQWRALGMPDLSGSLAVLPGVQPNRNESGHSLPMLRGIGTVTSGALLGTQQATTGLYLDDLPLTDPFGFVGTTDFTGFELARLQVLRGPQGVLYGSASLGGAIDVGLVMPRIGARGGVYARSQVSLAQDGGPGWGLAAGGSFAGAPDFAMRVEGFEHRQGGVVDNLGTGRDDADRVRRKGGRVAVAWAPAAQTELRGHLLHQESQRDDSSGVSPGFDERRRSTPTASWRQDRFTLARADVDTQLAAHLALRATVAWVSKESEGATDITRSTGDIGSIIGPALGVPPLPALPLVVSSSVRPLRSRAVTQEVRLADTTPDGTRWLLGLFRQVTHFETLDRWVAPDGAQRWGPFGALLPDDEVGLLQVAARSTESAIFGEASWLLASAWRLNAGARAYRTGVAYDATTRYLGQTLTGAPSTTDRGLMPRVSLQYDEAGVHAYALVSRGYRVGGVNFNPPAFTTYRSDRLLNQEVGARLPLGEQARAEVALFQMDWRDAQVSALTTQPVPLVGVANVGQARSRGLEAALIAATPTRGQATLRLAYTDARTLAAFTNAAGRAVPAGVRLPGTPRWQAVADVTQPLALADGWQGRARVDLTARSRRVEAIGSEATVPGRALLGLGLLAQNGSWQWQVRLDNAGNVNDVAGSEVIERTGQPTLTERFLSTPRRWTVTLRHEQ
jgi:iron complex outermembrane recepter protein